MSTVDGISVEFNQDHREYIHYGSINLRMKGDPAFDNNILDYVNVLIACSGLDKISFDSWSQKYTTRKSYIVNQTTGQVLWVIHACKSGYGGDLKWLEIFDLEKNQRYGIQ